MDIKTDKNLFLVKVHDGQKERTQNLDTLVRFGIDNGVKLSSAYQTYLGRFQGSYFHNLRTTLKSFGSFHSGRKTDLHCPHDTYDLLHDFRRFHYTDTNSKASLVTRNNNWMIFRNFIEYCMQEGIVAFCPIPEGNKKLNNRDILKDDQIIKKSESDDPYLMDTVVPIDLSRTDTEYLTDLEKSFRAARDTFLHSALEEIRNIEKQFKYGQRLAASISESELQAIFDDYRSGRSVHPFAASNHSRLVNFLAYIKYTHSGLFLGCENCGLDLRADHETLEVKRNNPKGTRIRAANLDMYLGRMTTRMLTPFVVVLLINNPKFRLTGLIDIEIDDSLSSAGEDGASFRLSVEKNRAKTFKSSILDNESQWAFDLVLELTKPFRDYLQNKDDPGAKKLFLVVNGGDSNGIPRPMNYKALRKAFGSGAPPNESRPSEVRTRLNSFLHSNEDLLAYQPTTSLRKLAILQAMVAWFESDGDSEAAAKMLGNSTKMAMTSYIPKPIQKLMNERMIRRFQNLIICSAVAGQEYMLEATDFRTLDELHRFLADILFNDPTRKITSEDIEEKLPEKIGISVNTSNEPGAEKVYLSICENSLAALFLYKDHIDSICSFDQPGHSNNPHSPRFWQSLAAHLHRILPSYTIDRSLQSTYRAAMSKKQLLQTKISFPKISEADYAIQ